MYWFKEDAERLHKLGDYDFNNDYIKSRFTDVIKDKGFYEVRFIVENDKYYIIFVNQPKFSARLVKYRYFGLCVNKEEGNEIYKRIKNSLSKKGYYRFPNIDDLMNR